MSTTVTFGVGGGSPITIIGPGGVTPVREQPRFVTGTSESHQRFVYQGTDNKLYQWVLSFQGLNAAERRALQDFYDSAAVNGPSFVWGYQHTDGSVISGCRFMDTSLVWNREGSKIWGIDITIETANEINPA